MPGYVPAVRRCSSPKYTSTTRARLATDILARMSRGCYEEKGEFKMAPKGRRIGLGAVETFRDGGELRATCTTAAPAAAAFTAAARHGWHRMAPS